VFELPEDFFSDPLDAEPVKTVDIIADEFIRNVDDLSIEGVSDLNITPEQVEAYTRPFKDAARVVSESVLEDVVQALQHIDEVTTSSERIRSILDNNQPELAWLKLSRLGSAAKLEVGHVLNESGRHRTAHLLEGGVTPQTIIESTCFFALVEAMGQMMETAAGNFINNAINDVVAGQLPSPIRADLLNDERVATAVSVLAPDFDASDEDSI